MNDPFGNGGPCTPRPVALPPLHTIPQIIARHQAYRIRAAIAAGDYVIDPVVIAEALLAAGHSCDAEAIVNVLMLPPMPPSKS